MERPDSSKQTQQIVELDTQINPNVEPEVTALATTDFNHDTNDSDIPTRKSPKRKRPRLLPKVILGVLLGAGVVAGGYYGHRWWLFNQKYQQTDNANVRAEIYPETARLQKQLQYAQKRQIPFVAIIGSDEQAAGVVALKNMQTGTQKPCSLALLLQELS